MYFGMDLHAYQKTSDAICRFFIKEFTGRGVGFVEADEGEVHGVEQVGGWIAILLNKRSFARAIFFVRCGRHLNPGAAGSGPLRNRSALLLVRQEIFRGFTQPGPGFRRIFYADEPGERQ